MRNSGRYVVVLTEGTEKGVQQYSADGYRAPQEECKPCFLSYGCTAVHNKIPTPPPKIPTAVHEQTAYTSVTGAGGGAWVHVPNIIGQKTCGATGNTPEKEHVILTNQRVGGAVFEPSGHLKSIFTGTLEITTQTAPLRTTSIVLRLVWLCVLRLHLKRCLPTTSMNYMHKT